jgi:hypothetical protein
MAGEESLECLSVPGAGAGEQLPGSVEGRLTWGRDAGSLNGLTVVNHRIPRPT